jgi:hypothetical protein
MDPSSDDAPVAPRRRRVRPQWTPEQLQGFRIYHETAGAMLDLFADRLTEEKIESLRTLYRVGEESFMMDMLCATLVVGKVQVTPAERDALAKALPRFHTQNPSMPYVMSPDTTLAALTVVDS